MKQGQFEYLYKDHLHDYHVLLESLEAKPRRRKGLNLSRFRKNKTTNAHPVNTEKNLSSVNVNTKDLSIEKFAHLYRSICHYHSLAKQRKYSSRLVDKLDDYVVRGHRQLYQKKQNFAYHFIEFFVRDFPVLIRKESKVFWIATALLYVPAIFLSLLIHFLPETVYTIINPAMVIEFEGMYDPSNRILGEAREADTNWYMFGHYINNNIGVSFRTFASGIVLCLGSVFFLFYNGLVFGAVAGHLMNTGYTETFFTFVIGHGSFELTAICISGAAGLKLGYALISPGNMSRLEALKRQSKTAIQLMYGVIIMLIIAAFVEAFWSSNNALSPFIKYSVGLILWTLVASYFLWGGRRFGSK